MFKDSDLSLLFPRKKKKPKPINRSPYGRRLLETYDKQTAKSLFNIINYIQKQYEATKLKDKYVCMCFDLTIDKLMDDLLKPIYSRYKKPPFRPIFKRNDAAYFSYHKYLLFTFEDFCMNLFAIKYVVVKKPGEECASASATNQTMDKILEYLAGFFKFKSCHFKTKDRINTLKKLMKEPKNSLSYKYLTTIAKDSGFTYITVKKQSLKIRFSGVRLANSAPCFNSNNKSKSNSNISESVKSQIHFLAFTPLYYILITIKRFSNYLFLKKELKKEIYQLLDYSINNFICDIQGLNQQKKTYSDLTYSAFQIYPLAIIQNPEQRRKIFLDFQLILLAIKYVIIPDKTLPVKEFLKEKIDNITKRIERTLNFTFKETTIPNGKLVKSVWSMLEKIDPKKQYKSYRMYLLELFRAS